MKGDCFHGTVKSVELNKSGTISGLGESAGSKGRKGCNYVEDLP